MISRLKRFFVAGSSFTLSFVVAGVALAQSQQIDPRDDNSPFAIASGAEWAGDYPRFNPMLQKAGVRWLRIADEWQTVQPKQGEWNWSGMDAKLADAKANGMRLTGGFWFFARWSSANGDTRTSPVKDMQFWRDYVYESVNRYKVDIKYWEVWNEFNGSFANSRNKPKEYADLVREAYIAARKADPTAKIGISCANFDLGFFDAAIKAGAAGHFDFVCVHPYENLGMAIEGNESSYLSLVGSIKKMLADNNQPTDMPLWITEIGVQAPVAPHPKKDAEQADALVKAYVLSVVQGFGKIFWFEARGPAYGPGTDHGLIRKDWTPRPAYDAMKVLSETIGVEPVYAGWLNLNNTYGFVFDKAVSDGAVLVIWAPPGETRTASFGADVKVVDLYGVVTALPAQSPLKLSRVPTYVVGVPADHVATAKANAGKPFPWGGDFANVDVVSCRLAATNVDKGIKQVKEGTTQAVNLLDQSYRRSDIGNASLRGEGHYAYFRVDPLFASFGNKELKITVVAKRTDPKKASSFGITYESLSGYKGAPDGRWTVPAGDEWHEHTWTVTDANFVGGWGWNFRTDAGGSPADVLFKEVRVERPAKTE